ncbi:prepilin-type N-terminal cleavage/methylation domain-containing protein [bacterium]|nr:prepilin-type N-terminal cleavage/methylation domain-containing protein [bacterium]
MNTKAFTLIELLIVVAIIGILASIAVPNFINAQVRAKTARAQADLRTISNAMLAYQLDENHYPPMSDNGAFYRHYRASNYLTTPVSYLSTLPQEPFIDRDDAAFSVDQDLGNRYHYHNIPILLADNDMQDIPVSQEDLMSFGAWRLISNGPDYKFQGYTLYEPTNGVASSGDIALSARGANQQLDKVVTTPVGSSTFRQ